jgi:Bacterial PH domain
MKHVFPLYPISRMTFTLLLVAAGTCLIPVVALWWRPSVPGAAAGVLCVPLAALFAWFAFEQRRSTIVVTDRNVILKVPIYGRTMELGRLIPDSLRKVTMKDPERYRLTLRTNGLGVPGYQLGWFRTKGAGRVLAAISGNDLVVWQTRDDYGVIVSPQDCDGLIAALGANREE